MYPTRRPSTRSSAQGLARITSRLRTVLPGESPPLLRASASRALPGRPELVAAAPGPEGGVSTISSNTGARGFSGAAALVPEGMEAAAGGSVERCRAETLDSAADVAGGCPARQARTHPGP